MLVKKQPFDSAAAAAWKIDVMASSRGCIVCGSREWLQAHHVIKQQILRARANDLVVPQSQLLWDKRIGVVICEECHDGHTLAYRRIPRYCLPLAAFQFADEYQLIPALERDYPK